jgi:hypothetical protein
MVRPAVHDLAVFADVLTRGAERMLDGANAAIEHGAHLVEFLGLRTWSLACR